jgi:adenylate kinase
MFKYSWLHDPAYFNSEWASELDKKGLPYIGEGNNLIPTIHISDLANFVVKVAEAPPEGNYLFAFDNSPLKTQKSIVESISRNYGNGRTYSVSRETL